MQRNMNMAVSASLKAGVIWRSVATLFVIATILFLALYNLPDYPVTWFDEGSHLHVPKTLARFGVYADYSSEGFRHYGPTIGIGPTVMLPIAGAFKVLGIGLLQARLVIVLYLLATVFVFYQLAHTLGGNRLAWVATALLVSSKGVSLIEYGRQVLGEVPALFFLIGGFVVWFYAWEKASWRRLALVGLMLGLSIVTKYQYLLAVVPSLGWAWLANWIYYRTAPHRTFIVPGLIAAVCFAFWQVCLLLYLGPSTITENLAMFRQFTAGAAMVLSPNLMQQGLRELLNLKVYLGVLLPALVYGLGLALARKREGQQWGILWMMMVINLGWYVLASISWLRYAFQGLAIASLFVARLFHDLTEGFAINRIALWKAWREGNVASQKYLLQWALLVWLVAMLGLPLVQTMHDVVSPGFNAPAAMSAYLDQQVPRDVIIETWEPEMGFLTDHNYHFPPPLLLNTAVGHIWLGGSPPSQSYDFLQTQEPEYVLVGEFARWVDLYPAELLAQRYRLVTRVGAYELYARH